MTIESEEFDRELRRFGQAYSNYFNDGIDGFYEAREELIAHIDAKMRERDVKLVQAACNAQRDGTFLISPCALQFVSVDPKKIIDEVDK